MKFSLEYKCQWLDKLQKVSIIGKGYLKMHLSFFFAKINRLIKRHLSKKNKIDHKAFTNNCK